VAASSGELKQDYGRAVARPLFWRGLGQGTTTVRAMMARGSIRRCAVVLGLIAHLASAGIAHATEEFAALNVSTSTGAAKIGDQVQLTVIGVRADGTQADVTAGATGTLYQTADDIVGITADGLVTITGARFRLTQASYVVWIIVSHGDTTATVLPLEVFPTDADGDGLDDDFERQHGLNPADPADASLDPDGDGLSNFEEFHRGTDPTNPDTDGDGVSDGAEVRRGSDPLNPKVQFALNEHCTASILNRTVQVGRGGSFAIPNVPVDQGLFRVRVTCQQDGETIGGQSSFVALTPNGKTDIQGVNLGVVDPIPTALQVTALKTTFNTVGETAQLTVTGALPDGTTRDLTTRALGTTYSSSNSAIAAVGPDGLITAVSRGRAIISARNEGVLASIAIDVLISSDADADGIPDEYEQLHGLNPNDPTDAGQDPDGDGLTNLQ
jgi:hypothetical protein